jgi:predicted membrane-bound spermidine synthase
VFVENKIVFILIPAYLKIKIFLNKASKLENIKQHQFQNIVLRYNYINMRNYGDGQIQFCSGDNTNNGNTTTT